MSGQQGSLALGDALTIARSAATGLAPNVQALLQPQRAACLKLLQALVKVGGACVCVCVCVSGADP